MADSTTADSWEDYIARARGAILGARVHARVDALSELEGRVKKGEFGPIGG